MWKKSRNFDGSMKELVGHIHNLLLENDCVIVPGFGGFIAHYDAAKMEEQHLFLPPGKILAFNPLLKINDGLLAQSYMVAYRTSFPDATRRIERAVKQLTRSLYENGSVYLPEIGELRFNIHKSYEFFPQDDKMTSPALYGLGSFEMPTLEEVKAQRIALQQMQERQREEEERKLREEEHRKAQEELRQQEAGERARIKAEKTELRRQRNQRLLRRGIQYTGALAAAIALLFLLITFSTPLQNTTFNTENRAELSPTELLTNLKKHSVITQPVGAATSVEAETIEAEEPQPVVESPAEIAEERIYHVIVASVGAAKDAENMAQQLVEKGYADAKAIVGQGYNRIAIGSFATESEAYDMVKELKNSGRYEQSWVLKRK